MFSESDKSLGFPTSKVTILKYVLVGMAFFGLVGWNANLQRRLTDFEHQLSGESLKEGQARRKRSDSSHAQLYQAAGAMFVRWGRRNCPNDESELVYSGIVGASDHAESGGSAEYTCLTREPQYAQYTSALEGWAKIKGVEFEGVGAAIFDKTNARNGVLQDADVVCAVCRSKTRSSQLMIPGRKECYPGWNMEYWGYLMTGRYNQNAQHNWACVDNTPEGYDTNNDDGGLMYHVQGVCGSLPCPNYVQGRELTCVVCTK